MDEELIDRLSLGIHDVLCPSKRTCSVRNSKDFRAEALAAYETFMGLKNERDTNS